MILEDFSRSWLSLFPAMVTIVLAIVSRRIVLSLFFGVIAGVLLLTDFSPGAALIYVFEEVSGIFWSWEHGSLQMEKVLIVAFLILIGTLYKLIDVQGGTSSFSRWAESRVNSPVKAQLITLAFGVVMFIDDYMNALISGNTCRPITDRHKLSRAKLAYIVDSTSAPVSVLIPFSSWGAYLVSLIAMVMTTRQIEGTPFTVFIQTIPYNLYALAALVLVLLVIVFRLDVFHMARHEKNASIGTRYDANQEESPGIADSKEPSQAVSSRMFFIPITVLVVSTVVAMVVTGMSAVEAMPDQKITLLMALEHTDPGLSLVTGALIAIMTALFLPCKGKRKMTMVRFGGVVVSGMQTMKNAIIILLFAWLLVAISGHMETAEYLSASISSVMDVRLVPALVFLVSCVIAFSTGSSWGTFGIMMPVAASFAMGMHVEGQPDVFVMVIAAMIAGAIFGDHCSPISDTTILSSIGAGCNHMDHVVTQLPYSILAAMVALAGYLVMGWTFSPLAGFMAFLVALFVAWVLLILIKALAGRRRTI